jgi:hypothetical protein
MAIVHSFLGRCGVRRSAGSLTLFSAVLYAADSISLEEEIVAGETHAVPAETRSRPRTSLKARAMRAYLL